MQLIQEALDKIWKLTLDQHNKVHSGPQIIIEKLNMRFALNDTIIDIKYFTTGDYIQPG